MNTRLYVNNLAATTTYNDLMDLFSAHGNVVDVNLPAARTNDSRGFGTVTMATPEGARVAVAALNGKQIDAHTISVNETRLQDDRAGLSGSGNGRRR